MSKVLIATIAAMMMVSTTHAAPYIGASSWSLSENASSKKSKKETQSLASQFLVLIGFDEKLSSKSVLGAISSVGGYSDSEKKKCTDSKPAGAAEKPTESGAAQNAETPGPEPLLFAF